jgi:hypothetical protein
VYDDPLAFAGLVVQKQRTLFGDDLHGVYWSTLHGTDCCISDWARKVLFSVSQAFYILILALVLVLFLDSRSDTLWPRIVVLGCALALAALFVPIEIQGRYHHVLAPVLSVAAGLGIVGTSKAGTGPGGVSSRRGPSIKERPS